MQAELPRRSQVPERDTWDLTGLYTNEEGWEAAFAQYRDRVPGLAKFKGTLTESADKLAAFLQAKFDFELEQDRLAEFAHLTLSQDVGDSAAQDRMARLTSAASKAEAELAFFEPELMSVPDDTVNEFLQSEKLEPYRIYLRKLLRMKPHILGESEERILSLQAEPAQTAQKAYSALLNSDLDFGTIDTDDGKRPLTQSSLISFLQKPDQGLRPARYRVTP